jgi:hypothetical protein
MISYEDLKDNKYTEEELENHLDDFNYVHWYCISEYQVLSESFIEKFKEKLDWSWISKCQVLSESFIEKYKDKLDWYWISKCQKLSENLILNNLELIQIDFLKYNGHISKELFEKVKFMKELL